MSAPETGTGRSSGVATCSTPNADIKIRIDLDPLPTTDRGAPTSRGRRIPTTGYATPNSDIRIHIDLDPLPATDADEEEGESKTPSSTAKWRIRKFIFYITAIILCILLCVFYSLQTHNVYHVFSWLAALCSFSYWTNVIYILLFSTNLCYHNVHYKLQPGTKNNYLPERVTIDVQKPYDSISHLSHIRGSSIHKWHTTLITYGSWAVIAAATVRLFEEAEATHERQPLCTRQVIAVWCVLCGGIGGLIVTLFEVYVSPTFSSRRNWCCGWIHTFGAFCYFLVANMAFAVFNGPYDWRGYVLFLSTMVSLAGYGINKNLQYKKNLNNPQVDDYAKWVHNMSRINVAWEVGSVIPSVIAICTVVYQFGV
eukprot:CAMPEP_0197056866 /NCGR_PEP_ID=MMETSP1384-20130603/90488_1 /TAXON_ID=29189 /ORGANISM="Ammonia sp." /LENGTH=367 /DNA_ID=CAMNT_0042491043 /DNA_START=23 /DNA_END=1126 /DNA_ORIENTATION=+